MISTGVNNLFYGFKRRNTLLANKEGILTGTLVASERKSLSHREKEHLRLWRGTTRRDEMLVTVGFVQRITEGRGSTGMGAREGEGSTIGLTGKASQRG